MAETAASVVKDILQELVVQGAEADLVADETQTAMRYMNRWMLMQSAKGVNVGYTKVSDLGDAITVPDGALMAIVKNVALVMARQFDVMVDALFRDEARDSLDAMRRLGTSVVASRMPCTLPIGSGNEQDGLNSDWHFYDTCDEDTILEETSRNILLEDNTNGD